MPDLYNHYNKDDIKGIAGKEDTSLLRAVAKVDE